MNKRNSYTELPKGYDINKRILLISSELYVKKLKVICLIISVLLSLTILYFGGLDNLTCFFVILSIVAVVWLLFESFLHEATHWIAIKITTGRDATIVVHNLLYCFYHNCIKREKKQKIVCCTYLPENVYLNRFASVCCLLSPFIVINLLILFVYILTSVSLYVVLSLFVCNFLSCSMDTTMAIALIIKCDKSVLSSFTIEGMKSYEMIK